ncbi:hypothetical protein GCM10023353_37690 [Tomitella cavernea]|uniref:Hemerythrin-like domain-containing protein n=2 Tax=Tomitella cavernea TaxID=1387982 RepID=A0ABP9D4M8_9ACTN
MDTSRRTAAAGQASTCRRRAHEVPRQTPANLKRRSESMRRLPRVPLTGNSETVRRGKGRPLAEETNVLALLTHERREVDTLFQRLETLDPAAHEQRRDLGEKTTSTCVTHTVAEEAIVYPSLAEHEKCGAARARNDHAEVEEELKQPEQLSADSEEFVDMLHTVIGNVRAHIAEVAGGFDRLRDAAGGRNTGKRNGSPGRCRRAPAYVDPPLASPGQPGAAKNAAACKNATEGDVRADRRTDRRQGGGTQTASHRHRRRRRPGH